MGLVSIVDEIVKSRLERTPSVPGDWVSSKNIHVSRELLDEAKTELPKGFESNDQLVVRIMYHNDDGVLSAIEHATYWFHAADERLEFLRFIKGDFFGFADGGSKNGTS